MTSAHRLLPVDGSVVIYMIVRGKDGRPTGYPMTGMFQGGQLEITTYRKAPKAQFLLAQLAERLGIRGAAAEERLAERYHELETGQLPPARVQGSPVRARRA